jgi:hypothetical protein
MRRRKTFLKINVGNSVTAMAGHRLPSAQTQRLFPRGSLEAGILNQKLILLMILPHAFLIQLTTDELRVCLTAIEDAFGDDIDCAMLQKLYESNQEGEARYSPAKCIGN